MGLDMFLYKVKRKEVAYWRKANAIHAWFERKYGEDEPLENCRDYYVSKEDLIELRDTCRKVINNSKLVIGKVKNGERLNPETNRWEPIYTTGKTIENPEFAEELLPRQDGFFFGNQEYDEWYINDLENTIEQIDKILEETNFDEDEIVYTAWW